MRQCVARGRIEGGRVAVNAGCAPQPSHTSLANQDDVRQSQAVRVRDRQVRARGAEPREMPCRGIVKLQLRRPPVSDNLEIFPQDAERVASADRLHAGFLGGKPTRQMRRRIPAAHAVLELAWRKYPL